MLGPKKVDRVEHVLGWHLVVLDDHEPKRPTGVLPRFRYVGPAAHEENGRCPRPG